VNSGDILNILARVKELGYRRFRLESDGFVLEVDTEAGTGSFAQPPHADAVAKPASSQVATPREMGSLVAVKAPMSGTFYRSPAPGAPPFVEVGTHVSADDTVCIIEVMKLFNSIVAGINGTVVELPVANEQAVATGQPVIWIRPG
jgi:acetyl-CoA carboxylase biotin carboxyl carrier protein